MDGDTLNLMPGVLRAGENGEGDDSFKPIEFGAVDTLRNDEDVISRESIREEVGWAGE